MHMLNKFVLDSAVTVRHARMHANYYSRQAPSIVITRALAMHA